MIKAIKHFFKTLFSDKEDFVKKNKSFENASFGRNIYDIKGKGKDFSEEMTFIHRRLKHLFLYPALYLVEWWLGERLNKPLSEEYHHKKLRMFSRACDRAEKVWYHSFRQHLKGSPINPKKLLDAGGLRLFRLIIKIYLYVCSKDSAYLELHNILMYEIARGMKGVSKNHLFYNDVAISDINYFILTGDMPPNHMLLAKKLVNGHVRFVRVNDGKMEVVLDEPRL